MRHPTSVTAVTVLAALAVGGCAGTPKGTAGAAAHTRAAPGTTARGPGTATAAGPLASVDPCSLLDPAVIRRNHLEPDTSPFGPGTGAKPGIRYCTWNTTTAYRVASGTGYTIAISIFDHAGLDQINTDAFTVTNYPVGKHQARLFKDPVRGGCGVSIGVSSMSRVDVSADDETGKLDRSCADATRLAPSAEQRLR